MTFRSWPVAAAVVVVAGVLVGFVLASPQSADDAKETAAVVKAMPTAKLTLAQGLLAAAKAPGAALSARFALQDEGPDKGRLLLSVFVTKRAIGDDAWAAGLRENWGVADVDKWTPEEDEMEEEDLARAASQATLLATTKTSLADVVARAEKAEAGAVISAEPVLRGGKPVFVVVAATDAKTSELLFDLQTGEPVAWKAK